jgi:hypothetical protein
MRFRPAGLGLLVLASTLGASAPASAELFTCHQRPGQVLYSYSGSTGQYGNRSSSSSQRYTSDFAASSRRQSQTHATSGSSRHYWNDRSRW